jgi:hypothetical protein
VSRETNAVLALIDSACGLVEGESLAAAVRRYGEFCRGETMHNLANLPGCVCCGVPPVVRPGRPWALVCAWNCGVSVEGTLEQCLNRWGAMGAVKEG